MNENFFLSSQSVFQLLMLLFFPLFPAFVVLGFSALEFQFT